MSDLSGMSTEELLRRRQSAAPRRGERRRVEDMSTEELKAAWKPTVAQDVSYSIPSALGRVPFVVAGAPADALGLGMELGRWFDEHVLGNEVKSREEVAAANPLRDYTSGALEESYGNLTGTPLYQPQTNAGKVVSTATTGAAAGAGFARLPGAVMGGAGGAGGEYARQMAEGTMWELPASIAGSVGGSIGGGLVNAAGRRAVTPRNIPKENTDAAAVLRREGIGYLTEGQVTRNPVVMAKERQRLNPAAYGRVIQQYEDLTSAALRKAGIEARRATPEVIDDAFERFNTEYRGLSSRNTLVPDRDFATDLRGALDYYGGRVSEPNRAPIIGLYAREMQTVMQRNNWQIPGEAYQSLRSRIQADARSMQSTDPARKTLFDMAEALDAAMERSITKNNPADAGGFRDLRGRYKNMLVIEDAVSRGSSEANLGLITGAALEGATKRVLGKRNWTRGKGDMAELARAAGALMRDLPQTGFAPLRTDSLFGTLKNVPDVLRMTPLAQRYATNRALPPPAAAPSHPLFPRIPGERRLSPAVPSITQQAPNYSPIVDALSQGPNGAPMSPATPQAQEEIARLLMQQ